MAGTSGYVESWGDLNQWANQRGRLMLTTGGKEGEAHLSSYHSQALFPARCLSTLCLAGPFHLGIWGLQSPTQICRGPLHPGRASHDVS